MHLLPIFHYPTTIVVVDDDPIFLQAITTILNNNYQVKSFSQGQKAVDLFQSYSSPLAKITFLNSFVEHEYYDTIHHVPVNFDISSLISLSNLPNRHNEVSILIVDYNMPGINGIELCKLLQNVPCKKILLTGNADHTKAIDAFNEKLIDCFISKASATLAEDLKTYLNTLELQYFIDQTLYLRNHLETETTLPLSDPIFTQFFNSWCLNNNIKEYYLIDKNGSFLLINNNKEKFYFIIYKESALNTFIKPYEGDETLAQFIDSIKRREAIPFFGVGVNPDSLEPEMWRECLYPPQVIEGTDKFYWHLVPARNLES